MAFVKQNIARYSRFFGLTEQEYMRASARIVGYLSKQKEVNANAIAFALKFLMDTIVENEQKQEKQEFLYNFQDPRYKKYQFKIVKLYQAGLGAQRISKQIAAYKGPKIPKSSIERFLKKNAIKRK